LRDSHVSFQFAIYYLTDPIDKPLAALDELLAQKFRSFRRVAKRDDKPAEQVLCARIEADLTKYRPPDLDSLKYFGHGLTPDQSEGLQKAHKALILDFAYPEEHVWDGMRSALSLTGDLARASAGLIWDEATREVFTPEAWAKRRIADWAEDVPDLSKHVVIHAYPKDGFVRAITLGMQKFGLPDLVIDQISWSLQRNMGHVMVLFAQALAENSTLRKPGEFDLSFDAIRNPKVREPQVKSLLPGATRVLLLSLTEGIWEEGDPKNRLIEIQFSRGKGPDIHAKQVQIIAQAFGSEDKITHVKHDEELKAASARARRRLPALRDEFNKGLAPGEVVLVKAPFDTADGGTEWMWVEVTSWDGDKITGLLSNDPQNIPSLHAGQSVMVSESRVFDFIRQRADGSAEGNETAKLIEQKSR
jgi:uncharacterized protein YegJ (DUF2314 family)